MSDTDRDPNSDSPITDDPATDESSPAERNERSDIERAVDARKDDAEAAGGGDTTSALEPTGQPDGVAGTGGVTKNQDDMAQ